MNVILWQPRISSNSGRYISVWEEGWITLKGFMTVWLWCIFEVLRGYFLDASTCATAGIFSILMKKKSWPEALWFMEWKFIHVGRLCMPLRFTSTGWFPVWQQLGQGPKTMPKHSRVISRRISFKTFFFQSIECTETRDCWLVNKWIYSSWITKNSAGSLIISCH